MRILFIGTGAIGSYFISKIIYKLNNIKKKKFHNDKITVLCRTPGNKKILKKSGIKITGLEKIVIPPGYINVTDSIKNKKFDIIFVFVKAYSVELLIKRLFKNKIRTGSIVFLQNGMGFLDNIKEILPGIAENIIIGITGIGATLIRPGLVKLTRVNKTKIGILSGKYSVGENIADTFNAAGIKTVLYKDIFPAIYGKLLLNSAINPVGTIYNIKNGEILKQKEALNYSIKIIKEIWDFYKNKKISIDFKHPFKILRQVMKSTGENYNSMLQDIRRNKKTEIDYINGYILKMSGKEKYPMPVNEEIYYKIKKIEKKIIK